MLERARTQTGIGSLMKFPKIKLLKSRLSTKSEIATVAVGAGVLLLVGAAAWWALTGSTGANAQQKGAQPRAVPVFAGKAERRDVPYGVDSIGTVQPIVSIVVRTRVDSQVTKVHFADGAVVKEGDLLYTLDSRAIDAQIEQSEAILARDKASLEKALRDVERVSSLTERNVVSKVQLADANTAADVLRATVKQDEAGLQSLRVLRTYYNLTAPVSGRIGVSGVREGSIVRAADSAGVNIGSTGQTPTTLATINQISPIYVAFGVPERYIADLRAAGDKASVDVVLQSGVTVTGGKVAFIENAVDSQTGTIMVRATFDNKDERLWPGTLASVRVTLRQELNVVTVPAEAVQSGQKGSFVFVIENGMARVRAVKVSRTLDGMAIVASGLNGGETVVTDGQLSLRDGSRTDIKTRPGAGA
jgi:multidrug efflux system membrane fusion protein